MVVGIGASAGGLTALRELFEVLPGDTGLAFVVVVHLSPDHESHLADLLQPHCAMPVEQVTQTVPLEADHVYVIAPRENLSAVDSHLRVSDLETDAGVRAPVDHFFRTLASTHETRAIGVVLTGTGSDGTAGLELIKDAGGLTIVQEPEEAEFDGMPRAAITSGYIDHVLRIAEIPDRILRFARTEPEIDVAADEPSEDAIDGLRQILGIVRMRTGHDMSGYKHATILRRLRRRMQLHQCTRMDEYRNLLHDDPDEAGNLFNDLLISVTNFFRDREVFEEVERRVVPELLRGKGPTDTVRVWSVGCSTGEEAYTLAMLLREAVDRMDEPPAVQVFATDLHEISLRRARVGLYPEIIVDDVSEDRLRRFFDREPNGYRIKKDVREMVAFAPHDLIRDPPFSHLDLVCCRNLLIYLRRELQQKVIELFHFALGPGGHLLLGSSESVDHSELFVEQHKSAKLFRRRDGAGSEPTLPAFAPANAGRHVETPAPQPQPRDDQGFGSLHAQMVERYAPPSVLVDEDHHILHYSTQAGPYLVHPGGHPTTDVVRLVREDLRIEVRTALHAAKEQGTAAASRPVTVDIDGQPRRVSVRVHPAVDHEGVRGLYLVIFDEGSTSAAPITSSGDGGSDAARGELEAELALTKQRLKEVITEHEISQEEMRASNEELQSTNEELRSTLDELETSKEELQSVNEELITLNQENRHRVEELRLLSGDLQNLLVGTDIATLFLDRHLRILRFTPRVSDLFNIRNTDRGRPLTDLSHRLGYEALQQDATDVLERLVPVEREVQSEDDRWFLVRVLPYRSSDDRIEGVVLTFIDITRRRTAELALRDSEQRLRLALDASQMGAWTWDVETDSFTMDGRAAEILGMRHEEADVALAHMLDRVVEPADRPRLRSAVDHAVADPEGDAFSIEMRLRHHGPEELWVLLSGRGYAALDHPERVDRLTGTVLDITDRKQTEQSLVRMVQAQTEEIRHTERRFRALVEAWSQIVFATDADGAIVEDSPQWRSFTGQSFEQLRGERWLDTVHADDRDGVRTQWRAAIETQWMFHAEFRLWHDASDDWHWVESRAVPLRGPDGEVQGWVGKIADVDERHGAEEKVRNLASRLTMAEHEERRRIAQFLHDDLQQRLYSVQMRTGILREQALASDQGEMVDALRDVEDWVASTVELTHHLTVEINPPILEHEGMTEALGWLALHMKELHGLDVEVHASESFPVRDDDMRVFLVQIVRELLFNVVKHADVGAAVIELRTVDGNLCVEIRDDGAGFEVDTEQATPRATGGLGLASARERLGLFGGRMDIESSTGAGTSVTVVIPLDEESR